MNLNDLPDEVLYQIFDNLDLYELKLASLVCRRWAELTFSGPRMDRVWLVEPDDGWELVLNTRRRYRNIRQYRFGDDGRFECLARLLRTLKFPVRVLDMQCSITSQQLRCILLEVPELQEFFIRGSIDPNCTTAFPVLTKLKYLWLHYSANNQLDFFRTNVLSLQILAMNCMTDREMAAWRHLSGQLKCVHLRLFRRAYFCPFFEQTFPHLEYFTLAKFCSDEKKWIRKFTISETISRRCDFFSRHPLLRRVSLSMAIPVEWIRSITSHCAEVTYIHFYLLNPEEGLLESLVQLSKLKYLSLKGTVDRNILRGSLKSLESVAINVLQSRVLLENLFEVVPQLIGLSVKSEVDNVRFICEKFSRIRQLRLWINDEMANGDSIRLDKLVHLQELVMVNTNCIRDCHRNNVRCLKIVYCSISNDDLDLIPEKFPQLNRLTIETDDRVSVTAIKWLHRLMPACTIDVSTDLYDKRFYASASSPHVRRSSRIEARNS